MRWSMAQVRQLSVQHNVTDLDEQTDSRIRQLCMNRGLTFIEARDKVFARRKVKAGI
ncbi:hypothetical protein HY491_04525 [Candidatus Woesearchaeota archaeon]|nr:hypothetical protein [Candidatus Woesearchaeota archaeon]